MILTVEQQQIEYGLFCATKKSVERTFPGYFALVMAIGIISIAAHFLHYDTISQVLFYLNNFFFAALLLILLVRLLFYFRRVAN